MTMQKAVYKKALSTLCIIAALPAAAMTNDTQSRAYDSVVQYSASDEILQRFSCNLTIPPVATLWARVLRSLQELSCFNTPSL